MWNNRNDFAIRQQFRADFRMTPDTFMDTFTLVRNRLEKQYTRFREAFPVEKRVAIAFRSSRQRCSMKKDIPRNFTKFTGKHLCLSLFFNKKHRSSRTEVFCKRGIPRNFAKFTGKHPCQSLYFNKVAGLGVQLY